MSIFFAIVAAFTFLFGLAEWQKDKFRSLGAIGLSAIAGIFYVVS